MKITSIIKEFEAILLIFGSLNENLTITFSHLAYHNHF